MILMTPAPSSIDPTEVTSSEAVTPKHTPARYPGSLKREAVLKEDGEIPTDLVVMSEKSLCSLQLLC